MHMLFLQRPRKSLIALIYPIITDTNHNKNIKQGRRNYQDRSQERAVNASQVTMALMAFELSSQNAIPPQDVCKCVITFPKSLSVLPVYSCAFVKDSLPRKQYKRVSIQINCFCLPFLFEKCELRSIEIILLCFNFKSKY